ncbi:hypothetical protein F2Q70_00031262 [Brassica cretica]|uniref:Uncharacterized protein n=1 Tax=Brassica cretica TaxID=69181 RepID=A0A8S9FM42_BRACR|nr:hypothetical protein F2Q70_00031262 [Brassica cretica]
MFFQHTGSTPFRQVARDSGMVKVTASSGENAATLGASEPYQKKYEFLREIGKERELPTPLKGFF